MASKTFHEEEILKAAEELFVEHGYNATSTTDIAKKVGCNQALIHYYFRNKENLFQQIFTKKIETILSYFSAPLDDDGDFFKKMTVCINWYFDFLTQNPNLPFFVLNELILNKERRAFIRNNFVNNTYRQNFYENYSKLVMKEIAAGNIYPMDPFDLLLDIISLTITNFIAKPIYTDLLDKDESEGDKFIQSRKEHVIRLIINGISLRK